MKIRLYIVIGLDLFFALQLGGYQLKEYTNHEIHRKQNKYRDIFSDLLLVIHFNHPFYSSIKFLKALYSPIFEHIVFYGEKPDVEVFNVYTHEGFFLSEVLQDVLTRFPNYRGYLIVQDDCIMNFWNCTFLDQDKIWFALKFNDQGKLFFDIASINKNNGLPFWNRVFDGLTRIETAQSAYAYLQPQDIDILRKNVGEHKVAGQVCDFFYIPHRFRETVLRLCPIFKNVFCEVAIPTMLSCLDSIQNWEQLRMLWGIGQGFSGMNTFTKKNYPMQPHWIHPVKFSDPKNREIVAAIFNQVLGAG